MMQAVQVHHWQQHMYVGTNMGYAQQRLRDMLVLLLHACVSGVSSSSSPGAFNHM
jgi:hypothetical protein